MATNQTFKMVNFSSYGRDVYENVLLENATINEVKKHYLSIIGNHAAPIFDRNFNENNGRFTLPNSFNTIVVTAN